MTCDKPHPALVKFRLCKEFGWTLKELNEQPAKDIEMFILIMNEIDRRTKEEMDRAKRGA